MKKVLLLTSMLLLVIFSSGWAQQKEVSGKITDSNGDPVPAATIVVSGTTNGTTADANGSFSLTAKVGDKLDVTSIGYAKQTVTVPSGDQALNITLQQNAKMLNETVVTALGISHEDAKLGYSISTVKGSDISRTNTVNPIAGLQGKVAGVQVNVMSSAGVQTSPHIQIRGAKVLGGNNQPIFVIDGNVIQNNQTGPDAADGGSQLKNLNPDDYASITVLKGAAATALYGSRGINGAIVITTKTGQAGKGIGVEFTSTYQTTQVYAPFMKLQNEFGMGSYDREGNFRPDGTQTYTTSSWGHKFDGTLHPAVYNKDTLVPYVARPDNWKAFYQKGNYINNNLTLSGGSEKYNYRLSYSNTSNKGILPNNNLKRNAVDIKVGGDINKIFSVQMGINYANTQTSNYYNQSRYYYTTGTNLGFNTYYMPRNTDFATW